MRNTALFITAALLAGCASTAAQLGFPRVDSDDDDRVSSAEFAEFLDDVDAFDRYDDNDDGSLSAAEYREAVDSEIEGDAYFRGFDRDRSNSLSRSEFANGLFGVYDADRNSYLSRAEFEAAATALAFEL